MHDRNGTPLKKGDIVLVPFVLTETYAGDEYCNCALESVHGRRPDGSKETVSSVNTGCVVLYERQESEGA